MLGSLSTEQVEQLLRDEAIGRIGVHAQGRTYVVPVTYAYEGGCVYAHSTLGRKVRMMRLNPEVCFEVEKVEGLSTWQSVIAWGRYEELDGEEAVAGMQLLVARLMPRMTGSADMPTHGTGPQGQAADTAGHVPILFRIRLGEETGRFERR